MATDAAPTTADEPSLTDLVAQEQATESGGGEATEEPASTSPEPDTPATEEPDADTPEPSADQPPADRDETEDAAVAEHKQWLQEVTGYSFDRYADDKAAGEAIKNALGMVGQRDEDAVLGRLFREEGAQAVIEHLRGDATPTAEGETAKPEATPLPSTWDGYDLLMKQVDQTKDPNDPTLQRAVAASRAFNKAAFQTVRQSVPQLEDKVAKLEERLAKQEADSTATAEQNERAQWFAEHRNEFWLKDDPKQLTALGQQVLQAYNAHPDCESLPDESLQRWRIAHLAALAGRPAPKSTQKPSKQAVRQASTAGKPSKKATPEDLRKQGITDGGKILELLTRQEGNET